MRCRPRLLGRRRRPALLTSLTYPQSEQVVLGIENRGDAAHTWAGTGSNGFTSTRADQSRRVSRTASWMSGSKAGSFPAGRIPSGLPGVAIVSVRHCHHLPSNLDCLLPVSGFEPSPRPTDGGGGFRSTGSASDPLNRRNQDARRARPREHLLLIVPGGQSRRAAASSTEYPSTSTERSPLVRFGQLGQCPGNDELGLAAGDRVAVRRHARPGPLLLLLTEGVVGQRNTASDGTSQPIQAGVHHDSVQQW